METVILPSSRPKPSIGELKAPLDSTLAKTAATTETVSEPEEAERAQQGAPSASATMDTVAAASVKGFRRKSNGLLGILSSVAWLMLAAGIIGAVLSWTTIGDVEAGMRIAIPENLSAMPIGLLLGFAYLATGALGFAFFWVSSIISQQLKDIRRLLILQPSIIAASAHADDFAEDEGEEDSPEA